MRVIFKVSAIVAVFSALTFIYGCGQSGPLYLPTAPVSPSEAKTPPVSSDTAAEFEAEFVSPASLPLVSP